jgi:hypothetical protein
VDVHLCRDETEWKWQCFKHAHGDFWNILGSCVRERGFTADEVGFHVWVAEIEPENKKAVRLHLTSDPATTLEFLGLDTRACTETFESVEAMFVYLATNRLFRRSKYVKEELKQSDRVRVGKRDIYQTFVEDWLPAHPEAAGLQQEMTREEWLEECLGWFGKRDLYKEKIKAWRDIKAAKGPARKQQLEEERNQCLALVGGYAW